MKTGVAICTTATSDAANVNTDCDPTEGPHNETSVAVNPTDPLNMIGGLNDYQLGLNPSATRFLDDYSNIAATPDGGVVAYWTDTRQDASFAGITSKGEDGFFAKIGP